MTLPDDLDILFAGARTVTPEDDAASERALTAWRSERRARRGRLLGAVSLASAAMLAGAVYLARPADLPTSAAYDAYSTVGTEGW